MNLCNTSSANGIFAAKSFKVGSGVLIPRADTETLIERACSLLGGEKELTVIDLCSGSGCIGITLEKKLDCKEVWCVEKSEAAMYFLKENATRLNSACKPLLGDVTDESLPEKLPLADLIISNPPYISAADMKSCKRGNFEPVALAARTAATLPRDSSPLEEPPKARGHNDV